MRYSHSVTVTVVTREDQSVDIDKLKRQLETKAEDLKAKRKVHEEAVSILSPSMPVAKIPTVYRWRSSGRGS